LRIWIAGLILVFLAPALAVTTANASHATHTNTGKGTIALTHATIIKGPFVRNERTTIVVLNETLQFTGNLTGTAIAIQRDVLHNVTITSGFTIITTFQGTAKFTGTLGGNSVTLRIRYEGISNSTFARGNFVISGDAAQGADVHGEGHFQGTTTTREGGSSAVNYAMHWTVATHTEKTETRDRDRD
jgi:hypothetical protein